MLVMNDWEVTYVHLLAITLECGTAWKLGRAAIRNYNISDRLTVGSLNLASLLPIAASAETKKAEQQATHLQPKIVTKVK